MIDPITFEVLRHRLSTIIEEGAAVLRNVSGSPSVAQSNDCNVALLTAAGEGVIIGRFIASHGISCIQTAQHVLEEYADNPGIRPDDMFFCNHPYIGTPHQTCGVMVAPIFVGDRIVAWSGAGIHFGDVGGSEPGQVSVGARSIWDEAIPVPPIKIVEGGMLRKDLEAEFLTRSRTRIQNAVDLKAMVGGNNAIKRRILALVHRYGADTVVEALEQVISVSEAKMRGILSEIPDGRWHSENYLDYYDENRMKIYACRLALTKQGESLVFDFTESSDQAPAVVNATLVATEGFLMRAILGLFGFAVSHCPAAVQRIIRVEATPGTIVHCSWPAGVCKGTTSVTQSVWQVSTHCMSQMLLGSERHAERATAVSRGHLLLMDLLGTDQYGAPFAAVLQESCLAAGSGAGVGADGIDTGGITEPEVAIPNVESNEFRYPILYLYRRQRKDSEGPGRQRGGLGLSMAFMPHDVAEVPDVMIHCHGVSFPSATGLSGGHPGAINRLAIKRNTDVKAMLAAGVIPGGLAEIEGDEVETPPSFAHSRLGAVDVFECEGGGGGGYGDPLERDPVEVVDDVRKGRVSGAAARSRYGVVLTADDQALNAAATETERSTLRANRRESARSPNGNPAPGDAEGGAMGMRLNEYLGIASGGQGPVVRCRCGRVLGDAADDFREGLAVRETVDQSDAIISESSTAMPSYTVKEFFCPGCWTLVHTEVLMAETETDLRSGPRSR